MNISSLISAAILFTATAAQADTLTGTIADRTIKRKVEWVYVEKVDKAFPPPKEPAVMNQTGNTYQPHVLPVVVGTKVSFKSGDPELHNVFARASTKVVFNQAVIPMGSYERVMSEQGFVHLSCNIHKEMSAWILVLQNPYFAKPDPTTGAFTINDLPPGTYTLRIWGEKLSDEDRERKFTVTVGKNTPPVELAAR